MADEATKGLVKLFLEAVPDVIADPVVNAVVELNRTIPINSSSADLRVTAKDRLTFQSDRFRCTKNSRSKPLYEPSSPATLFLHHFVHSQQPRASVNLCSPLLSINIAGARRHLLQQVKHHAVVIRFYEYGTLETYRLDSWLGSAIAKALNGRAGPALDSTLVHLKFESTHWVCQVMRRFEVVNVVLVTVLGVNLQHCDAQR